MRVDDEVANINKEREMLRAQMNGGEDKETLSENTLIDYIALAKEQDVDLSEDAEEKIIDNILELRVEVETGVDLDISGRELEKLTRLSSAMCKLRLGDVVTEQDVERASALFIDSYDSLTFDNLDIQTTQVIEQ